MDDDFRVAAFNWLREQTSYYGDVLDRKLLEDGFPFRGQSVTLIGPQGIWKPAQMELPISITTTIHQGGQYHDFIEGGLLEYSYRGGRPDVHHRDNSGLREVMRKDIALVYFYSVVPRRYLALWPVYIVGDDLKNMKFTVAIDDAEIVNKESGYDQKGIEGRRRYLTSKVLVRLHGARFREIVLLAYRFQCALCRIRHPELLDAAHIIGDKEKHGDPVIQNGLSLCKIHHAAFDRYILSVDPDYKIRIRQDVLEETDGPMLQYGIKSLNDQPIILPGNKRNLPDKERLEERFSRFLKAG